MILIDLLSIAVNCYFAYKTYTYTKNVYDVVTYVYSHTPSLKSGTEVVSTFQK